MQGPRPMDKKKMQDYFCLSSKGMHLNVVITEVDIKRERKKDCAGWCSEKLHNYNKAKSYQTAWFK